MTTDTYGKITQIANDNGLVTTADVDRLGIPRVYLKRMLDRGILNKSGRGIYYLTGADLTETFSLAEVCRRVPNAIVCLLSALRYHGLGTQNPADVWVALPGKAWRPAPAYPPLHVVRFSPNAITLGSVVIATPEGPIRVFDEAKTVVDCFRYRNKIGIDVAVEALREYRSRNMPITDVAHYAAQLRAARVMRPYLEAIQ